MKLSLRALMAGEPRYNTPDTGSGDAGGSDDPGKESSDLFDKGFGKGAEKGRKEGISTVLSELGVSSLDDARAAISAAAEAREAAKKAAEEQGNFEKLYREQQQQLDTLKQRAELADRYEAGQKQELAAITEKLAEEDRGVIDGLPLDKALALAKRLSKATSGAVGNGPASNGTEPGKPGGKDLAWYENKGYANLTADERSEAERLMAERDSMTIAELKRRHQVGGV